MADMRCMVGHFRRKCPESGYRRIAALHRDAGWFVNDKPVERQWRCEGLKVPMKQPKKGRLCLTMARVFVCDRSTATKYSRVILAIVARNNGAINGSMHHRTDDGKAFRTLNILDEHSRECLFLGDASIACRAGDDPDETEAELDRGCRYADGHVYLAQSSRLHSVGQRPRVHCSGCPRLDCSGRR